MNFKKIISILLIVILMSSSPAILAEENNNLIAFPANGDTISDTASEVNLSIDSGYDVTLILDGEKAASFVSEGNDVVSLPKKLSTGAHTLAAVAKKEGNTLSHKVNFTAEHSAAIINAAIENFPKSLGSCSSRNAGKDADGVTVRMIEKSFEGIDGTPDGAHGFMTEREIVDLTGNDSSYFFYGGSRNWTGVLEIEYDIKLFGNIFFEIETKGDAGFGYFGKRGMFKGGKIASTSHTYLPDTWMHVKHVIDVANKKESLYVDGNAVLENETLSTCANIFQLKFQVRASGIGSSMGCALDNLSMIHNINSSGISDVSYARGDEYIVAPDSIITEETSSLKFSVPVPTVRSVEDASSLVTLTANGEQITPSSASIEADGAITVNLAEPLSSQADMKIEVESRVSDTESFVMTKSFASQCFDFGVTEVSYQTTDGECYIADQINPGDEAAAVFTLKNQSGSERSAVLIAAVYNGNRIAALSAKEVLVPHGENAFKQAVDITFPEKTENYRIECYMLEDFTSCNVLSKVWMLK